MSVTLPPDIRNLHDQLEAAERDSKQLVAGLSAEQGVQAPEPGRWSVSECLDHLATGNRVYLDAMKDPAARARAQGRLRRRPAIPGVLGALFVASLEPPPRWWSRLSAPRKSRPRTAPPLAETAAAFLASQPEVRAFLLATADLDLAGIRFPNPFIPWIFFSLATGFHVLVAHGKRHLLQGWVCGGRWRGGDPVGTPRPPHQIRRVIAIPSPRWSGQLSVLRPWGPARQAFGSPCLSLRQRGPVRLVTERQAAHS